jgi:hypothetical protein
MMNRINKGSIISRPATARAKMKIAPTAYRCGRRHRRYARRYSRRLLGLWPFCSGTGAPPLAFVGPFAPSLAFTGSSSRRCLYCWTKARYRWREERGRSGWSG